MKVTIEIRDYRERVKERIPVELEEGDEITIHYPRQQT